MFPAGFEPTIPASERPQTHALDRAATGIGSVQDNSPNYCRTFGDIAKQVLNKLAKYNKTIEHELRLCVYVLYNNTTIQQRNNTTQTRQVSTFCAVIIRRKIYQLR
jgi:hypothetical protein